MVSSGDPGNIGRVSIKIQSGKVNIIGTGQEFNTVRGLPRSMYGLGEAGSEDVEQLVVEPRLSLVRRQNGRA